MLSFFFIFYSIFAQFLPNIFSDSLSFVCFYSIFLSFSQFSQLIFPQFLLNFCFILGAFEEDYKPKIISFWLTGEGAKFMENLTENQIKSDLVNLLRKFLPGKTIPDPIGVKFSTWNQDENFLGSYSYQTVESQKAKLGPKTLEEPLAEGRLLFAGEATHSKYFSTVHGAIESGWREADRVIVWLTEK